MMQERVKGQFEVFCKPRHDDRYGLYRILMAQVLASSVFLERLANLSVSLDEHRRRWLPYLFFGSVQYLVLRNPDEPVAQLFPSSVSYDSTSPREEGPKIFEEFVWRRWSEITQLVKTREIQTNKLGRLALFAPFFVDIEHFAKKPLAFVEIGSSVGLGLLWPYFGYDYSTRGKISGYTENAVLRCEVEGVPTVALTGRLPIPKFACGIDPVRLSAANSDDVCWLEAFVAPDDWAGRESLRMGLAVAKRHPPSIREGCVLNVLPLITKELGPSWAFVLYHAMTMHHLADAKKLERYYAMVSAASRKYEIYEIGVEWEPSIKTESIRPVYVTYGSWASGNFQLKARAQTDDSSDGRLLRFR